MRWDEVGLGWFKFGWFGVGGVGWGGIGAGLRRDGAEQGWCGVAWGWGEGG